MPKTSKRRYRSRLTLAQWGMIIMVVISGLAFWGMLAWSQQQASTDSIDTQTPSTLQVNPVVLNPSKVSTPVAQAHPAKPKSLANTIAKPKPKSKPADQPPKYHPIQRALSPDLRKVVTSNSDDKLRIWDLETGDFMDLKQGHFKSLTHFQVSPDSRTFATTSHDETTRVWDINTGEPVSPILTHDGVVKKVLFFDDGSRLLTCDDNALVWQWDIQTGKMAGPLVKFTGYPDQIKLIDNQTKVIVSCGYNARIFDLLTGKPVTPLLEVKNQWASCDAAFSHDGKRIAFGWHKNYVQVWDLQTAKPVTPKLKHQTSIRQMAFSSDDSLLLTVDYDKSARLWDAVTGKPMSKVFDHVRDAMFIPNTRKLLLVMPFDRVVIWDVDQPNAKWPSFLIEPGQRRISRDGRYLLNLHYNWSNPGFSLLIWDFETGLAPMRHKGFMAATDPTMTREILTLPISDATFSPDGQHILTVGGTSVRIWDANSGRLVLPEIKLPTVTVKACYSPDGKIILVTYGYDQKHLRLFDAQTSQALSPELQKSAFHWQVFFTNDSKQLIAFDHLTTARIWDTGTGQVWDGPLKTMDKDKLLCNPLVSNNGKWRLERIAQDQYQIHDMTENQQGIAIAIKPADKLAFSPDSRMLAVALRKQVRVWDIESDTPLTPELHHPDDVTSVAISPDGKWLLTGCRDGQARLWDIQTGKCRDYYKDLVLKLGHAF